MTSTKHENIAKKLARIKGTVYHSDKGVDLRTRSQAIEVEVFPNCFGGAKRQLAGSTRSPYLAVPKNLVSQAVRFVNGTRFGVMSETGKIYKRGIGR